MKLETKFKIRAKKDLDKLSNIWVLKTQEKVRNGIPDFLICLKGRFIAIELKAHNDSVVEPLQLFELGCIEKAGGKAIIATPQNWEILYAAIEIEATL